MKGLDPRSQIFATDESHSVIRLTSSIRPQCVDGNNSRMFQLAGNLAFLHKPGLERAKFWSIRPDLLQCHLPSKLFVFRYKDDSQPTLCMFPDNAETVVANRIARPRLRQRRSRDECFPVPVDRTQILCQNCSGRQCVNFLDDVVNAAE